MAHGDAAMRERTQEARTVDPARAERTYLNGASATAQDPVVDEAPRTAHSLRCEQAYRDWQATPPSQRPLAVARGELARAFDAAMHAHWLAGEGAFSNVAVARSCGIDERNVRQWRDGEKAMPVAALLVMPATLTNELVTLVRERRGLAVHQRGLAALAAALDQLEARSRPTTATRSCVRSAAR